jgi:hypothetical protein
MGTLMHLQYPPPPQSQDKPFLFSKNGRAADLNDRAKQRYKPGPCPSVEVDRSTGRHRPLERRIGSHPEDGKILRIRRESIEHLGEHGSVVRYFGKFRGGQTVAQRRYRDVLHHDVLMACLRRIEATLRGESIGVEVRTTRGIDL